MEQSRNGYPLNTLSLNEREVDIDNDEKQALDSLVGKKITELFDRVDHTSTLSTRTPIELNATPLSPPNGLFYALVRTPYRRAHIEAAFDESKNETSSLLTARILLFEPGIPYRGELVLVCDDEAEDDEDEEDEEEPNLDSPNYVFITKEPRGSGDRIPLRKSDVKDILDGLIAQANEYVAITQPDRTLEQSIRALLAVSADVAIEKQADYRIKNSTSGVAVSLFQESHTGTNKPEIVESYRAIVTENHTVNSSADGTPCNTTTSCTLLHAPEGINTKIEATYESNDTEYDIRSSLLRKDLEEFNDMSTPTPGRFSTQILDGLELLTDAVDSDATERVY